MRVRLLVVAVDVQRFGAVGERVHRGADRRLARQVERQIGLVDDAPWLGARPAAAQLPAGVAHAVVRRPLGAGVGGRHRYERYVRRGGDGLAEVDRAPAAHRDHAALRLGGGLLDADRGHLAPPADRLDRELPARAGDEQRRPSHARLVADGANAVEPPADDHARRDRANSTKACATRVSARPAERTSEISREGSSPSTRATATVPAARSASIAEREMNVTP